MARPASIRDEELLQRLSTVFRETGYDAASLAALSEATGLKKASLYHRFPGGKEQMAREVVGAAGSWLAKNVLEPLRSDLPPDRRVARMLEAVDDFYDGGRRSCLLNTLSSTAAGEAPFGPEIRGAFEAWIDALATALVDAGVERGVAKARAEHAVASLQGSLVLARGLGSTEPFRRFVETLPEELFAAA